MMRMKSNIIIEFEKNTIFITIQINISFTNKNSIGELIDNHKI